MSTAYIYPSPQVFELAEKEVKKNEDKTERLLLLEAWVAFEVVP